ncbi:10751_t:CDS:2 [Cetraspora pellucida]|uniref:10751_t:CDS:1 n=1 Tax=Cetraspora pellucida TaxID=1433469 RepID=A0ACA9K7I5_9GLOM|nr:10751_t:CDS:2 [Cetraspora pellucida]
MSSIFIAYCFVKTVSGNDKFINGSALYCINDEDNEFREFIYKGFTGSNDSLIIDFEKNSIVLMIGRYVYHDNVESLGLIQTIPISALPDSSCSPEDLPYAFPLLIYTAPAVTNSYKFNDNIGRQSFMLSKRLYNPVNGQKGIESNVIVSYTNANGRYDSLKEGIKKSVISAVGRLKINKFPHIISSEIEWSYASNESKSSLHSSGTKAKSTEDFNNQLDMIEEQYATMNSQPSNKRKRGAFFSSPANPSNNTTPTTNLEELANQIRTNQPEAQQTSTNTPNKI